VALIDSAQRETGKPRMMRGFFIIPWLRYPTIATHGNFWNTSIAHVFSHESDQHFALQKC
jgi:hypothetical protein